MQKLTIKKVSVHKAHQRATKSRVYVFESGESIIETLQHRHSRPHNAYRPIVQRELEMAGFSGKLAWSQKAGCGCGCSPGFVLDGAPVSQDGAILDVFITLSVG